METEHVTPTQDRIRKKIILRADRDRVWRAIADAKEFGSWFGVTFDGPFRPGAKVTGKISPTTVDADRLPRARREEAFVANEQGWGKQMKLIERYLATTI